MKPLPPQIRLLAKHSRQIHPISPIPSRTFATSPSPRAKNRIYTSVRSPPDLDTLLLLSASARTPLLTFWTATWCSSCKTIAPLIRAAIEKDGIGEKEGGVGFVEVEVDSPTGGDLAARYTITSVPTLMAFSRQEAQVKTRVTSVEEMRDGEFLRMWIEEEARRGGEGGAGGGLFGGLFGLGR